MGNLEIIKALGLKVLDANNNPIDVNTQEDLDKCVRKVKVADIKNEPFTLYRGFNEGLIQPITESMKGQ